MKSRIRLVVAGAGAFGREHIRLLATNDEVDLVGIADIHPATAQDAANQFGVPDAETGSDAIDLIGRLRPDGLIVATPGPTHVGLAGHALGLGIPVLVEKPVAMSSAEASALADAASSSAAFVLPGHVLRFSEPHRQLVAIARSEEIGPILSVTARRHRDESHAVRYAEDPVLMTMIHDIDLAMCITGRGAGPAQVFATRRPPDTARSETLATVAFGSGAVWRLATAWTFPAESCPSDRIAVVGERGSVELDVDGTIRVFGADPRRIDVTVDYDAALVAEHDHFVACIRSGAAPTAVTLDEATAGLAIAEAILASLESGEVART